MTLNEQTPSEQKQETTTSKNQSKTKCHVEVFSRVTGFFRPTSVWNPGKVEEFKDRQKYILKNEE